MTTYVPEPETPRTMPAEGVTINTTTEAKPGADPLSEGSADDVAATDGKPDATDEPRPADEPEGDHGDHGDSDDSDDDGDSHDDV